MKKIYFAIAACAMFAFTACNSATETTDGDSTGADTTAPAPEPAAPATTDSNTTTMDSGTTAPAAAETK